MSNFYAHAVMFWRILNTLADTEFLFYVVLVVVFYHLEWLNNIPIENSLCKSTE